MVVAFELCDQLLLNDVVDGSSCRLGHNSDARAIAPNSTTAMDSITRSLFTERAYAKLPFPGLRDCVKTTRKLQTRLWRSEEVATRSSDEVTMVANPICNLKFCAVRKIF